VGLYKRRPMSCDSLESQETAQNTIFVLYYCVVLPLAVRQKQLAKNNDDKKKVEKPNEKELDS